MPKSSSTIVVPKTWRSEYISIAIGCVMSILCIFLSYVFPWSIIAGEILPLGSHSLVLHLPLFWFMPFASISAALYRIYNVRYTIHPRGIDCVVGILSLNKRVTRLWFEDIRSIQTNQVLTHRIMGIGNLEISTAATGTIEVVFRGIAAPEEVQDMLQRERDKRQKTQHIAKNHHNIDETRTVSNS